MKRLLFASALAICLSIGSPLMSAQGNHGNGNGNGNGHGNDNGHGNGNGNGHGNKHYEDHQGWDHRENYEYRTYGPGHYPPGWNHGMKTGWGNCGMPPGQAKKYGCRTYTYQGVPYYYYPNEAGGIIVRRPFISVQGGITIAP
jgi:hypothetical protein